MNVNRKIGNSRSVLDGISLGIPGGDIHSPVVVVEFVPSHCRASCGFVPLDNNGISEGDLVRIINSTELR